MQFSDNESKMSVSNLAESVESGEILSSNSEWNTGLEKLFVRCLNDKIEKTIQNYLNLFIDTCLNHMSIRSRLVSQPKNKLLSNNRQSINTKDLWPITFGLILPPSPCGKISTNSQNNLLSTKENENSKVCTIKILLDSGASASIV